MTDFAKQLGEESEEITVREVKGYSVSDLESADVDIQVRTARAYPRDLQKALKNILFLATQDKETADNCFYSVKRDGKTIRGASIRLAEIITSCYGNIRASSRVISNDGKMVTAQGMCWDLENNVAFSVEVKRRITDKFGRTFSDDLIVITSNACSSIALRNAIFKVVPQAITSRVQNEIKNIVLGKAKDFESTRKSAIEYFTNLGVEEKSILELFNKKTIEDLDRDDIFDLRGIATAIIDGDITLESAFSVTPKTSTAIGKASRVLSVPLEQGNAEFEKTNIPKVKMEDIKVIPKEEKKVEEKPINKETKAKATKKETKVKENTTNIEPNENFLSENNKDVNEVVFGEDTLGIKPNQEYKLEINSVTDAKGNEVSPSIYAGIKQEDLIKSEINFTETLPKEFVKEQEDISEELGEPVGNEIGNMTKEEIDELEGKKEKKVEETENNEIVFGGEGYTGGNVVVLDDNDNNKQESVDNSPTTIPINEPIINSPVITDKEPIREIKKKYKKYQKKDKGSNDLFDQNK